MSCVGQEDQDMELDGLEGNVSTPKCERRHARKRKRITGPGREGRKSWLNSKDWKKKLDKPRMGMVADLEEEASGKKNPIIIIAKTTSDPEKVFSNSNFKGESRESLTRTVTQDIANTPEQELGSSSLGEENCDRIFHFVSGNQMECNDSLEEDCGQDLEMTDANIIIKINQDVESDLEAINNNDQEEHVDEAPEDLVEMTVINKIAAIKEIDRKLQTIEKERSRKLQRGAKCHKQRTRSPQKPGKREKELVTRSRRRTRRRKRSSSSSNSSSSSSSDSDSDSSSDSGSEAEQKEASQSKQQGEGRSGKGEVDLKEKLRHYLTKANKQRTGRK